MNRRSMIFLVTVLTALITACDTSGEDEEAQRRPLATGLSGLDGVLEKASTPIQQQLVEWEIDTDVPVGTYSIYALVDGSVQQLDRLAFHSSRFTTHSRYAVPADLDHSHLLAHITHTDDGALLSPREALCFARINHEGSRARVSANCDRASTITFYMSATSIPTSQSMPFGDAHKQIPAWSEMYYARDNDLIAFLVSAFGTVENTLVHLGAHRFHPTQQSIRPVMAVVTAKALDIYQRTGELFARDIVAIADDLTGGDLPLARLLAFYDVYERHAHIEEIQLRHTGGSLTRPSGEFDIATLSNELKRFFLKDMPLEMADYRTHTPQNIRSEDTSAGTRIAWDPLPHMFGYNVYFDRVLVHASARSAWAIPPELAGEVTIHAVGHAGEFDGQRFIYDPSKREVNP